MLLNTRTVEFATQRKAYSAVENSGRRVIEERETSGRRVIERGERLVEGGDRGKRLVEGG